MASVSLEDSALTASGWIASDSTRRYWQHPARYGEAFFDTFEVQAIESGGKRRAWQPRRAPACRCAHAIADQGTCVKCGRRVC